MKKQAAIVLLAFTILLSAGGGVSWAGGGGSGNAETPTCAPDANGVLRPQFVNDDCWHRYNGNTYKAAVARSKLHWWPGTNVSNVSSVKYIGSPPSSTVNPLNSIVTEALQLEDYVALTQSPPDIAAICQKRFPDPCDCSRFPALADQTSCKTGCTQLNVDCVTSFNSLNDTKAIQNSGSVSFLPDDTFKKMVYDVGQVLREVDAVTGDIVKLAQATDPTVTVQVDALKLFLSYKDIDFTLASDASVGAVRSAVNACATKYPGACSPACDTVAAKLNNGSTMTLSAMATTEAYGPAGAGTMALAFCRAVQDPPGATPSKDLFEAVMSAKVKLSPCQMTVPPSTASVPCTGVVSAASSVQLFNNTLRELALSRGYYFNSVDTCSKYVASIIPQEEGATSAWVQLDDIKTLFACRIIFSETPADEATKCVGEVSVCAEYCAEFLNCPAVGDAWKPAGMAAPPGLSNEVQMFCKNQASLCACAP